MGPLPPRTPGSAHRGKASRRYNSLTRCKEVQAVAMPSYHSPDPPQSCERRDGKEGRGDRSQGLEQHRLGPAWACQGQKQHLLPSCSSTVGTEPRPQFNIYPLGFKCLSSRATALEGAVPGADGRGQCRHKLPAPRSYSSCLETSS